jgi:ElaB/YqjD/DUF883 family membrane-anchored ribosome-binding protein
MNEIIKQDELHTLESAAELSIAGIDSLEVIDEQSAGEMITLAQAADEMEKRIILARKKITDPLKKQCKYIDGLFNNIAKKAGVAKTKAKKKIEKYLTELQKQVDQKNERMREKHESLLLEMSAEQERMGNNDQAGKLIDAACRITDKKERVSVIGPAGGKVGTRKVVDIEVVDIVELAKHHPEFLSVDRQAIIKYISSGNKVDGVKTKEKMTLVLRV